MWDLHGEKLRYLVVGAWNTLFGYLLFLVLLALLGDPLRSLGSSSSSLLRWIGRDYYVIIGWIGWAVAVPQSTVTMKYLVFRGKGSLVRQIGRAYFVYLPAQGIGSVILWLTVRVLHLSPQVGALVTIAVTTVFSYIGHKYFTFRTPLEVGEVFDADLLAPHARMSDDIDTERDPESDESLPAPVEET